MNLHGPLFTIRVIVLISRVVELLSRVVGLMRVIIRARSLDPLFVF